MSFFLESLITMSTKLALAIFLATAAFAAVPASAPPAPTMPSGAPLDTSTLTVLGHHCDKYGNVDALAIATDGAGPHFIAWNNENICGKQG